METLPIEIQDIIKKKLELFIADANVQMADAIVNVDLQKVESLLKTYKGNAFSAELILKAINEYDRLDEHEEKKISYINAEDAEGNSALIYAAYEKYTNFGILLINLGADVNLKDKEGNTALHLANNPTIIEKLLQHPDIKIEEKNKMGLTPLAQAVTFNDFAKTKLLLEHNADATVRIRSPRDIEKNKPGKSLLETAEEYLKDDSDITKLLRQYVSKL